MDTVVAVCLGIGLAAACGFRVFVPLLMVGVAARAELLTLASGFEWIASWVAVSAFAVAAVLEIGAYYLPWLDNGLDVLSSPAAVVAGVILSVAFVQDMDPMLKWTLGIIAGGGAAGTVKAGLTGLRLGSTATTAGTGNPLVSTVEWIAAVGMSLLSIFLPALAGVLAIILVAYMIHYALRVLRRARGITGSDAVDG